MQQTDLIFPFETRPSQVDKAGYQNISLKSIGKKINVEH